MSASESSESGTDESTKAPEIVELSGLGTIRSEGATFDFFSDISAPEWSRENDSKLDAEYERLKARLRTTGVARFEAKVLEDLAKKNAEGKLLDESRYNQLGRSMLQCITSDRTIFGFLFRGAEERGANERGGPYSENGIVFSWFTQFVGGEWRLPTKKELDAGSGQEGDAARRARRELGLRGLPTGR